MSPLLGFLLLVVVAYAVVTVGMVRVSETDPPPAKPCLGDCVKRSLLVAAERKSVYRLRHWRAMERDRNRWKRVTLARPSVVEAINLACTVYGHCAELWRKARCETGGTFSPYAKNPSSSASGLFQFLTSTWAGTPFGRYSIWDPYANALAAGWMHVHGRGNEWSCR